MTPTGDKATSYKIDYSLKSADNAELWALNIKTVPYTPYRTMALKYAEIINQTNPTTMTASIIGYANMHM